jgi:hypothetical protein
MADPQGLDVHDMQIAHVPSFDRNGNPQRTTLITYHVGPHGPFMRTYQSADVSAEQVNGDINKHVAELRAIVARPGS